MKLWFERNWKNNMKNNYNYFENFFKHSVDVKNGMRRHLVMLCSISLLLATILRPVWASYPCSDQDGCDQQIQAAKDAECTVTIYAPHVCSGNECWGDESVKMSDCLNCDGDSISHTTTWHERNYTYLTDCPDGTGGTSSGSFNCKGVEDGSMEYGNCCGDCD